MKPFPDPFLIECLRGSLKGRKILLGISGSIAAFKACDLVRFLRAAGAEVQVVLTESAEKFVTRLTLETLSGRPVLCSMWETGGRGTHHIELARWADLAIVAPATANTVARLAHGRADDLLSTELLAYQGALLIAPAMNPAMYAHPATRANLETLRARGVEILGPSLGLMACGEHGEGRMLEPLELAIACAGALFAPAREETVLVTLGPTLSRLDPVRYLTNRSSGKMGAALVWELAREGYAVEAICGPVQVVLPSRRVRVTQVESAQQMRERALEVWPKCTGLVAAAAVLDFGAAESAEHKLKKQAGAPAVSWQASPDVLAELGRLKRKDQWILGFAAETQGAIDSGRAKLSAKNCDAVFVNDVSRAGEGFESDTNAGLLITRQEVREFFLQTKPELARMLVSHMVADRKDQRVDVSTRH
jgi:phosphopantothenoylcysteine decarboxylase/phosphopantothenate--cysteine ligase